MQYAHLRPAGAKVSRLALGTMNFGWSLAGGSPPIRLAGTKWRSRRSCTPLREGPNSGGLSAPHIRRACEASLRRLQHDKLFPGPGGETPSAYAWG